MGSVTKAAQLEHQASRPAVAARDSWIVRVLGQASEAADQPPLIALSLATFAGGAVLGRREIARAGARMLAAHALATGAKTMLKHAVDRTRPERAVEDGHRLERGHGADDTELNSFPSGHSAGAVAVAQAAARDLPGIATPARVAAAAMAAIQVPRGKHYVSDVLVGAAIGWASEAAVSAGSRFAAGLLGRRAETGSITRPVLVPAGEPAGR